MGLIFNEKLIYKLVKQFGAVDDIFSEKTNNFIVMFKNVKSAKNLLENVEFATSNLGQVDLKIYFSNPI